MNMHNRLLLGSQLLRMSFDRYAILITQAKLNDLELLRSVHYDGRDLSRFLTEWKTMVMSLDFAPDNELLESYLWSKLTSALGNGAAL